MMLLKYLPVLLLCLLSSCSLYPSKEPAKPACDCPPPNKTPPAQVIQPTAPPMPIEPAPEPSKSLDTSHLKQREWDSLSNFNQDELQQAWPAWLQSCQALKNKAPWQTVCSEAAKLNTPTKANIANFFRQYFNVYALTNADETETGLITGYYEPLLRGSRTPSTVFQYPLYQKPSDLVSIDLGALYPELANKRVRGRLKDGKVSPYYTRSEIESTALPLKGNELLWIDDLIDIFFLQIQGSGLVKLETGETIHVGYADQNGYPYQSIGKKLIERGALTPDQASMQGIKNWAWNNPSQLRELLNSNPSYVFFKELPPNLSGPLGALGVPIAAERSLAIDTRYIPLGAPVYLETSYPNTNKPLNRLMLAQDTGGAIKGVVRADFFWGAGEQAGKQAGAMKQQGKMWVLLPKEFKLN